MIKMSLIIKKSNKVDKFFLHTNKSYPSKLKESNLKLN
jgi:hypothetical protein